MVVVKRRNLQRIELGAGFAVVEPDLDVEVGGASAVLEVVVSDGAPLPEVAGPRLDLSVIVEKGELEVERVLDDDPVKGCRRRVAEERGVAAPAVERWLLTKTGLRIRIRIGCW